MAEPALAIAQAAPADCRRLVATDLPCSSRLLMRSLLGIGGEPGPPLLLTDGGQTDRLRPENQELARRDTGEVVLSLQASRAGYSGLFDSSPLTLSPAGRTLVIDPLQGKMGLRALISLSRSRSAEKSSKAPRRRYESADRRGAPRRLKGGTLI